MSLRARWPEYVSAGTGIGQFVFAAVGASWNNPILKFVVTVTPFTAMLTIGIGVGIAIARKRWRKTPSIPPAERFVVALHRRWFPGPHAGLDLGYRVSMFVPDPDPAHPTSWRRLARTGRDDGRADTIWQVTSDPGERPFLGLVVLSATTQMNFDVQGVVANKRNDHGEIARYRTECAISERMHEARSWKWASIRTQSVRGANGEMRSILVVERESGEPIEIKGRKAERHDGQNWVADDICVAELQLSAEVWSAAKEDT